MTRALLLAAGFGTRLGTLSDERPKPLLPVCDIPLIRYGVALCRAHGIEELAVNLHHRGDLIEAELGDGRALGVSIRYSREETIRLDRSLLKPGRHILEIRSRDAAGNEKSLKVPYVLSAPAAKK